MMPISLMEDNRIFDVYGNSYALFVIDSRNYAFLPLQKKIGEIRNVETAVSSHVSEYDLYLLTKQLSLKQTRQTMRSFSSLPEWKRHIEFATRHVQEQLPFERINFLAVPLKKRVFQNKEEDWQKVVLAYLNHIWLGVRDVKDKFQRSEISIAFDVLESSRKQAVDLFRELRMFEELRPATIHEVEWFLKKGYFRGLSDPELMIPQPFPVQVVSKSGKEAIRPVRNTLLTLNDVTIREKMGYLKVHHGDGAASYQTFYPSLQVPNNINEDRDPTGREWIYKVLERADFPIDLALHIRLESHTEARGKVKRKNKIAKNQVREWQGGEEEDSDQFGQSSVPDELMDDLGAVDELMRKFREQQQPLMHLSAVFGFGASSYEELQDRMARFKVYAESAEHILAHPPADMKKLFQSFYPFGPSLPQNWEIPMDPGVLAVGVPFGVRKIGDPIGFYLGKLLPGRAAFMNPLRPIMELQRTAAILICGALGSGKTVLMKYIIKMLLDWGGYCFTNDPKGDWAHFFNHPEVQKVGKLISFTPGSTTTFSPLRLAKSKDQCYEAAYGVLELMFNPKHDETRNVVISQALSRVYEGDKWDMYVFWDVVKDMAINHPNLKYREHAEMIENRLANMPNHSVARMIFGEDTGKHLFEDKRFICAITRGLSLPGRSTPIQEWSDNERYSVAMLYAIIVLALRYLMTLPQSVLKGLAWEEFWFLKRFEKGRQLYDEMLRLSRSEKMVPIMASQNPTDIEEQSEDDDDVTGLFGWKFMLRLDSKKQVEYALHNLLEMVDEDPDDWVNTFSDKYKDGLGLVRDPEGRVGELQVEILDPELMKYLVSTPPKEERVDEDSSQLLA